MADKTGIEWTDATWNPITGCSVVSPGCTNCYAMRLAGSRMKHHPSRAGLTDPSKAGPVWNGQVRFNQQWLDQPLKWKRTRRIFVCAHGDLFHENVPDAWIDKVFAVMALSPQHSFQVLTKRSARMRDYLTREPQDRINAEAGVLMDWDKMPEWVDWPTPNAWLGVSVEDQARAEERIPDLLETPAAVRFVSAEPLLEGIGIVDWILPPASAHATVSFDPANTAPLMELLKAAARTMGWAGLDWVIVGGESGPGARPMHPGWVRSLRDQCAAAGVPFFFKQWGAWAPAPEDLNFAEAERFAKGRPFEHHTSGHTLVRVGKKKAAATLDGRTHQEFPQTETEVA